MMLLCVIALLLPVANADGTFFIAASKNVRLGMPYDVHVNIIQPGTSAEITALIGTRTHSHYDQDVSPKVVVSKTQSISGSGIITLQVPESIDLDRRFLELNVSGTGGVTFKNNSRIEIHHKKQSIFVQTDKARYKPGDEVKFRIFSTGADLRAHTGNIDVEIYDGDKNKIKQWLDTAVPSGLFSQSLQLSKQPILGKWTIKIKVNGEEEEKTFKVEEYVLPKFKVEVELPSFVTHHLTAMDFTVKANYTFGKPVNGDALVMVRTVPGYACFDPYGPDDGDQYNYINRKACKSKMFKANLKDGKFSSSISKKDMEKLLMEYCYDNGGCRSQGSLEHNEFEVVANVTEKATGEVLSGRSVITIQQNALKVSFLDSTPNSYKPGLDWKAWIKVERPDGKPPSAADIKGKLKIQIFYYCPYVPSDEKDECETGQSPFYEVDMADYPSGLIQYTLPEAVDEKYETFEVNVAIKDRYDQEVRSTSSQIRKFKTETEKNIQIQMDTLPALSAGSTANFKIKCTEDVGTVYYLVLSKGQIVIQDVIQAASPSMQHELVLTLDANLAQSLSPNAKLIVFYFADADDGKKEAIADSVSFNVDATFAYNTEVTFSKSDVKPAEQLTVNVESAKDSQVALLAVDQSVLLLESGNDITVDKVEEEVRSYDPDNIYYPWLSYYRWGGRRKKRSFIGGCYPIFIGGSDIKAMMRKAGMIFMCDCVQAGNRFDGRFRGDFEVYYSAVPAQGVPMSADTKILKKGGGNAVKAKVRSEFPETWLWTEASSGDGKIEIPVNAPDTITSWVLSAFAINPELGLSVASTAKTTVFQPFFVRLSMPYSVVRGEQFALKITVFNYLPSGQDVSLVIDESDKFKVVDGNATLSNSRVEKRKKVQSQGTATEVIWVVPQALGQIPIRVSATSGQAGDIVIRKILVKAEGAPKTYSESEFMEVQSGSPTVLKFLPDIPDNAVPGSGRVVINVVGDIMGSAMENLEDLVKMPYGCGEQNMVNFAPNIYVLQYLTVTGQDEQAVKDKSIKFMDIGYQKEMTYKRKDHSFSAFGDSDKEGSTWLTAFVMKCFSQAKDFIKVEENVLKQSSEFLMKAQNSNGEFRKIGMVHHKSLKGGAGKGVSLTAYTAIALLELQQVIPSDELEQSIKKAVTYLEGSIESIKDDAYTLSIVAYALAFAKSSQASYALNQLNALSTERKGMKFWSDPNGQSYADIKPWERYYATPPLDVETASYALMATLVQDGDGVPIVRWLTSRMNPQGGFYSTQDTVMGLEALGKFAEKIYSSVDSQNVNVEALAMNDAHTFDMVTKSNSALVQVYEAPAEATEITVTATGQGAVVVQMTVSYNMMDEKKSKEFDLDVKSSYDSNSVTVSVCMSYNGEEESGMSIMQVESLSGFYPDGRKELEAKYKNTGMKIAEVEGAKMITYWDEVTTDKKCIEVVQKRADSVMNLQQQQVKVYKYYAPESQQAAFYQVPAQLQSLDVCVSCPDCEGCESYNSANKIQNVIAAMLLCLISAFVLTV